MSKVSSLIRLLIIVAIVSFCIIVSQNHNFLGSNRLLQPTTTEPTVTVEQLSTKPRNTQNNNTQTSKIAKPDLQIEPKSKETKQLPTADSQLPIAQKAKTPIINQQAYKTTSTFEQYKPKYTIAAIHPTNFGDRYSHDIYGKPLNNQPLAVLHETVGSFSSTINTFRTPHKHDSHQVSYHALIALDGTIIYLVPSDKRAFGAGNSVFESPSGIESVKTKHNLPPSVNNFAYHISLETPPDGRGNQATHSGYSDRQYHSLAWLLAMSSIPDERITTHKAVDRSGHRFDPRSFDFAKFFNILHTYRQLS
jgi:hypothetical protein